MKLIPMTDFVLELKGNLDSNPSNKWKDCLNYAKFLKQPLELGMFVPCDEDGNVVEKPEETDLNGSFLKMQINYDKEVKWEIAKERCLFEGFSDSIGLPQYRHYISDGMQAVFYVIKNGSTYSKILGMKTIEDLTNKTPIQLSQTAIKQLGL